MNIQIVNLMNTNKTSYKYVSNLEIIWRSNLVICACFIFMITCLVIVLGFQYRTNNRWESF